MTLLTIVITLIVVGVLLGAVNLIPMASKVKEALNVIVVLFLVLWVMQGFGLINAGLRLR